MRVNKQQTVKYRPSLTATQISKIIELAKLESPISDASISIISTLSAFSAKISNDALVPAYKPAPPKPDTTSLSALGTYVRGTSDGAIYSAASNAYTDLTLTVDISTSKEQLWEDCYNKYKLSPMSCSVNEILCAKEHMYLNDLMSPEELAAFELKMFQNGNQ